jgi:hypothetical protein
MNETPDFDAEAERRVRAILREPSAAAAHIHYLGVALRLIWNARGTADMATVESHLAAMAPAAVPSLKHLARALKNLDR